MRFKEKLDEVHLHHRKLGELAESGGAGPGKKSHRKCSHPPQFHCARGSSGLELCGIPGKDSSPWRAGIGVGAEQQHPEETPGWVPGHKAPSQHHRPAWRRRDRGRRNVKAPRRWGLPWVTPHPPLMLPNALGSSELPRQKFLIPNSNHIGPEAPPSWSNNRPCGTAPAPPAQRIDTFLCPPGAAPISSI